MENGTPKFFADISVELSASFWRCILYRSADNKFLRCIYAISNWKV
jgi:hypothetical protein